MNLVIWDLEKSIKSPHLIYLSVLLISNGKIQSSMSTFIFPYILLLFCDFHVVYSRGREKEMIHQLTTHWLRKEKPQEEYSRYYLLLNWA